MESRARPQPQGRAGPVPLLGLRPPTGSRKRSPDPGLLKSLVLSPEQHHGLWTRRWVSSNSRQGVRGSRTAAGGEEKGLEPLVVSQGHHSAVESNSRGLAGGFPCGPKAAVNFKCWSLLWGSAWEGAGAMGILGSSPRAEDTCKTLPTPTLPGWQSCHLGGGPAAERFSSLLLSLRPSPLPLSAVLDCSPGAATWKKHKLDGKRSPSQEGVAPAQVNRAAAESGLAQAPTLRDAPVPPQPSALGARPGGAGARLSHHTRGFLGRELIFNP